MTNFNRYLKNFVQIRKEFGSYLIKSTGDRVNSESVWFTPRMKTNSNLFSLLEFYIVQKALICNKACQRKTCISYKGRRLSLVHRWYDCLFRQSLGIYQNPTRISMGLRIQSQYKHQLNLSISKKELLESKL